MSAPLMLVITGRPATGKTTLARRLATDTGLPLVHKDALKESLFDSLGIGDRAHSRRLGYASIQLLRGVARELLQAGDSLIVESNFSEVYDGDVFRAMARELGACLAQVWLVAATEDLVARWERRAHLGTRHPGHVELASADEVRGVLRAPGDTPLALPGPLLALDTTKLGEELYNTTLAFVQMALDGAGDDGGSSVK
jgi:predicted kinase